MAMPPASRSEQTGTPEAAGRTQSDSVIAVLHVHVLNLLTRRLAQVQSPGTLLPDSALAFLHPFSGNHIAKW
jgi:hypothetical protein